MKKTMILAGLLLASMLFMLSACYDDVAPLTTPDGNTVLTDDDDMLYPAGDCELEPYRQQHDNTPEFDSITGILTGTFNNDQGDLFMQIDSENGTVVFMTYFNTFFLGTTPELGDTITGYFPFEMEMAMIYPPQHMVSFIINNDSFQDAGLPFVHVCRFFERNEDSFGDSTQLICTCGELVINLDGDSEITLQSGEAFDGELAGRMLVVTYARATFSIPPITTPIQIIVLYERAVTGPEFVELPDNWEDGIEGWTPHYDIIVDGEGLVGAHVIFIGDDAIFPTHLELTPVAAALGADVEWNQDTNEVALKGLNGDISFIVGSYDFTVDGETVTLFLPSVDFYGTVYVPISFFRDVFGMASAYSQEGRFYISSTESDMN